MRKVLLLPIVGVALLLVSRVPSPAEPAGELPMLSAAQVELAEQNAQSVTPVARQIDQEAERLRQRLAQQVPFDEPARDPFRFTTRSTPKLGTPKLVPVAKESDEVQPVVLNIPKPPAILVPTLIALTADEVGGAVVRTAVLSMNDEIAIVKVGQAFDRFQITSITADAVELVDITSPTKASTTLTIK